MELVYTLLQWDEAEMELVPEITRFHPSCCYYAEDWIAWSFDTHTHTVMYSQDDVCLPVY